MNPFLRSFIFIALAMLFALPARADISKDPDVQAFIASLVNQDGFKKKNLNHIFQQVNFNPKIITAMNRPFEAQPWYIYKKALVSKQRIKQGVQFWNAHAESLAKAQQQYGVAPEIIVAIIGVESNYGQNPGNFRVIDTLSTLAFQYPKRAPYFRSELRQFLLMAREQQLNPLLTTGSYAGAIGIPQFMPTSCREYAVDFSGKPPIDLDHDPVDAIGSIANYLNHFGWKANAPIAQSTSVHGPAYKSLKINKLSPLYTEDELKKAGVTIRKSYPKGARANLIQLQGRYSPQYWLGFTNFYAITAYNASPLYAMAVFQLGEAIRKAR